MFTMDAALHGCQRSFQAITAGELGKGLELLLAVAPVLLVQTIPQECRCLRMPLFSQEPGFFIRVQSVVR